MKAHVRKDEVWFKPWYSRKDGESIFLPGGEEKFNSLHSEMKEKYFVLLKTRTSPIWIRYFNTQEEAENAILEEEADYPRMRGKLSIRPPGDLEEFNVDNLS
jgi:hypothetical protein